VAPAPSIFNPHAVGQRLTSTLAPGSALPFKNDRAPYSLLVCKTMPSPNQAGTCSEAAELPHKHAPTSTVAIVLGAGIVESQRLCRPMKFAFVTIGPCSGRRREMSATNDTYATTKFKKTV